MRGDGADTDDPAKRTPESAPARRTGPVSLTEFVAETQRMMAAAVPRLATTTAADLASLPPSPVPWLVEGVVPRRQVTILSGDGGTGKSTLALQLAVSVAAGVAWLGLRVEAGDALYLAAEDDPDELRRRLVRIASGCGVSLRNLDRLHVVSFADAGDAALAVEEIRRLKFTTLMERFEASVKALAPKLIVLDNLADVFAANELDRTHARGFVARLRALAQSTDAAVLILSHPSQSGTQSGTGRSGSNAFHNSARAFLYLTGAKDDPDTRVLSVLKQNYGPRPAPLRLRWRDGAFVLDDTEADAETAAPVPAADRRAAGDGVRAAIVAELRRAERDGRRLAASGGRGNDVCKLVAGRLGVRHSEVRRAVEELLTSGTLLQVEVGAPTRRRKVLELRLPPHATTALPPAYHGPSTTTPSPHTPPSPGVVVAAGRWGRPPPPPSKSRHQFQRPMASLWPGGNACRKPSPRRPRTMSSSATWIPLTGDERSEASRCHHRCQPGSITGRDDAPARLAVNARVLPRGTPDRAAAAAPGIRVSLGL